jgi:multidrug efflux pump
VKRFIAAAVSRSRTVLLLLFLIIATGAGTYLIIPKEAAPEIDIPIFFVTVLYPGIAAEDAERLLLPPLERELLGLNGLDEMRAWAGEGFAMVRLDFLPGFDSRQALADVREQVDQGAAELPAGAETPQVSEVDVALFPVLTVTLSGPFSERTLVAIARALRDRIETLPGVLEVEIGGDREELMEIIADPLIMETYQLSFDELIRVVERNNQLVAAGVLDSGVGRVAVKVPGTINDIEDVLNTPVAVSETAVLTVADLAEVRQTFKDPQSFARINGQPAVSLEIRKRGGANIIEVVAQIRALIEEVQRDWPQALEVTYLQDQAEDVADLLGDLENNVLAAVILVVLVILGALGLRASLLAAMAIPGSFLGGILAIYLLGFTLNIVVLFALILVVGLLVDGAIVVVELADRHIDSGLDRTEAFPRAAQRMAWPIIAATFTTLAVFFPMLFWPGQVGEFIRFLPATVIVTLLTSLTMALIFIPTLGTLIGPRRATKPEQASRIRAAEEGRFEDLRHSTGAYLRLLKVLVVHPGWTLLGAVALMVSAYLFYILIGRGVEFFPHVEPQFAQVQVQARGNLSIREADDLVRRVEARVRDVPEVQTVYARTIGAQQARLQGDLAEDVIGIIQVELIDWRLREPASAVLERMRRRTADLPGIALQFREQERGPGAGKPIVLEISGPEARNLLPVVRQIRTVMAQLGGFVDVDDDLPLPGVELELRVDREEAARYGADVTLLGRAVQMVTDGVLLGTYRPEFTDEEVDIRLRFPMGERHLQQLANLRVPTQAGLVPIANFVELVPVPATGLIKKRDGRRAFTISADAAAGLLVDDQVRRLREAMTAVEMDPQVFVAFRGQAEEQAEAGQFLVLAFIFSIFLMMMILVTQFNSFMKALLVLSAIVFSTAGVLLGLLVRGEAFSIVMSGIGVLALAGIVVNNNIVLIDTYDEFRSRDLSPAEAALRTGAQRLRPVVLTAVTTILGLMPMVLGWTINFFERDFYVGAPSTDYWIQLATAIAGGLAFSTPLTLLFTPAMLVWLDRGKIVKEIPDE